MPADMKELIAAAAVRLMQRDRSKRVTVKDIVEECHITRQTFYYHFEDVVDLLDWMIRRDMSEQLERCLQENDPEKALKRFMEFALKRRQMIAGTANTGYRDALERVMLDNMRLYLSSFMERTGVRVQGVSTKTALDYHVFAIVGVLLGIRSDVDLERTVHELYLLLTGEAGFTRN